MIVDGKLPTNYNYTDVPQLNGYFVNSTHVQEFMEQMHKKYLSLIYRNVSIHVEKKLFFARMFKNKL